MDRGRDEVTGPDRKTPTHDGAVIVGKVGCYPGWVAVNADARAVSVVLAGGAAGWRRSGKMGSPES